MYPPWKEKFTPATVHDLLRNKVLKSTTPLPGTDDYRIVMLAETLNVIHWKVQSWKGPWRQELKQLLEIGQAIWVLTTIPPKQRKEYVYALEMAEKLAKTWGKEDLKRLADAVQDKTSKKEILNAKKRAQDRLAAFDNLVAAAHRARAVGLPMTNNPMLVMAAPIVRAPGEKHGQLWRHYARDLGAIFCSALPKAPEASKYRFVEKVIPAISGERPSCENVEITFKQPKRFRKLPSVRLELPLRQTQKKKGKKPAPKKK